MNILIVEDDLVVADGIGMILTQAGYYHVHARTIKAALS